MRNSYSVRVLITILGLVVVLQSVTFLVARGMIRTSEVKNSQRELNVAGDIFTELLFNRGQQLFQSAEVLVSDFAFRDAVASADEDTIRSALLNHATRISADYAAVTTHDGLSVSVASTSGTPEQDIHAPGLGRQPIEIRMIGGIPYEVVTTPIAAPLPIGQASLGVVIDEQMAIMLQHLSGVDVSFVAPGTSKREPYIASTLAPTRSRHLPGLLPTLDKNGSVFEAKLGDASMLTLGWQISAAPHPVYVVLQTPMQEVLAPFHALTRQMFYLNLGGLVVALLVGLLLARDILRPLRQLENAAGRISDGQYDVAITTSGKTEFATLARAFNDMQRAIEVRESQIRHQARTDPLTGIGSRSMAPIALDTAIAVAAANHQHCAALTIDIKQFRAINSALGHQTGDALLKVVAERLGTAVGDRGTIIRLGSDVFLAILHRCDADTTLGEASRLAGEIQREIAIGDIRLNIQTCIGCALYPDHANDAATLMRRSDIALQAAKQRNETVALYLPGSDEQHQRRLELLHDLKVALASDTLQVAYQPKAGLKEASYVGAEALLRWTHPRLGPQNPEEFIALAENAGYIGALTHWVLKQGIRQLGMWHAQGHAIHLSINISAHDLLDPSLPALITEYLLCHNIEPAFLCLEITESSIMQDTQHSLQVMYRLKALGVRLSVDDFGTGYSSLSQLKKLPVDELKIDKGFVLNLPNNNDDMVIVRSTIDLAHSLELSVVAEGVETMDAESFLREHGCDVIQGYYLGKPMTPTDFSSWLSGHHRKQSSG